MHPLRLIGPMQTSSVPVLSRWLQTCRGLQSSSMTVVCAEDAWPSCSSPGAMWQTWINVIISDSIFYCLLLWCTRLIWRILGHSHVETTAEVVVTLRAMMSHILSLILQARAYREHHSPLVRPASPPSTMYGSTSGRIQRTKGRVRGCDSLLARGLWSSVRSNLIGVLTASSRVFPSQFLCSRYFLLTLFILPHDVHVCLSVTSHVCTFSLFFRFCAER